MEAIVETPALPPGAGAHQAARRTLRQVLRRAQALAASGERPRIIARTAMGGDLGLGAGRAVTGGDAALAAGGALAGAWRCAARELGLELTVVDGDGPVPSGLAEVALGESGARVPVLREGAAAPPPSQRLGADSVVVLLGGARGVTAAIAGELARRFHPKLVLVGRTPQAEDVPRGDRAALRRLARERLGADAPLAEVNALASALERQAELAATLERLAEDASAIEYAAFDASDGASMQALLRNVRARHGRIDVIVHGAGIDRSRALAAKTEEELDLVLAPKVGGLAEILAEAGDALVVALGSVSARFGNEGQIDYGAANDAMARLVVGHGGLVIDFTAWADIGMAAALTGAMRERGVDLLPPDLGARLVVDAIAQGRRGEWVACGRLPMPPSAFGAETVFVVPGAELERRVPLVLEQRAFLRDHRPTAAATLPGVVALELMLEAARALEPGLAPSGLEDVVFASPVKVFEGRPSEVRVACRRGLVKDGCLPFACSLHAADGREHHRARVLLAGQPPAPVLAAPEGVPAPGPDAATIYRLLFHGPSFQVIARVFLDDGLAVVDTPVVSALAADLGPYGARALAREAAFQAAGLLLAERQRVLALPSGVARLVSHAPVPSGEPVRVYAWLRESGERSRFDALVVDQRGRPLEELFGLAFQRLGRRP